MKTDFKVYKRKIDVFYKNELTSGVYRYAYSTNAYKTCKDARDAAIPSFPNSEVKTSFAQF